MKSTLALILIVCASVAGRSSIENHSITTHPLTDFPHSTLTCYIDVESNPQPQQHSGAQAKARIHACAGYTPIHARFTVIISGNAVTTLQRGEKLTASGHLHPLRRERAGIIGTYRITHIHHRENNTPTVSIPNQIRAYTAHALKERSRETQALIRAIGIGDRTMITRDDTRTFQRAGISHLIAVSGLHTSIILGTLTLITPGRGTLKLGFTTLILTGIVTIMGPTPSVIRACLMSAISSYALWRGEGSQAGPALAFTTLAMILWNPWNTLSLGFALSISATAGLIWPARWGGHITKNWIHHAKIPQKLRPVILALTNTVLVSSCAQAATIPILLIYGMNIPMKGIVANLAIAPTLTPLCLGSFITAASATHSPHTADTIAWMLEPLCQWVFTVARH